MSFFSKFKRKQKLKNKEFISAPKPIFISENANDDAAAANIPLDPSISDIRQARVDAEIAERDLSLPSSWSLATPEQFNVPLALVFRELKSRAEISPQSFLPFNESSSLSDLYQTRQLVDLSLTSAFDATAFRCELKVCESSTLLCYVKWCWSRTPRGILQWKQYSSFAAAEDVSNAHSFNNLLSLMAPDHATLLESSLEFIASLIARYYDDDSQICKSMLNLFSWWLFDQSELPVKSSSAIRNACTPAATKFLSAYFAWTKAAKATGHIFLCYLRNSLPGSGSSRPALPGALRQFLASSNYPPNFVSATDAEDRVVNLSYLAMVVDSLSKDPLSILQRDRYYGTRADLSPEDKLVLQILHTAHLNPFSSLTEENVSVMDKMTLISGSTHSVKKRSNARAKGPLNKTWSIFQATGFDHSISSNSLAKLEETDETQRANTSLRPKPTADNSRPKTLSWDDFSALGFSTDTNSEAIDAAAGIVPPSIKLPPVHEILKTGTSTTGSANAISSQALSPTAGFGQNTEPVPVSQKPLMATVTNLCGPMRLHLDFYWVWLASHGPEQPKYRQRMIGNTILCQVNQSSLSQILSKSEFSHSATAFENLDGLWYAIEEYQEEALIRLVNHQFGTSAPPFKIIKKDVTISKSQEDLGKIATLSNAADVVTVKEPETDTNKSEESPESEESSEIVVRRRRKEVVSINPLLAKEALGAVAWLIAQEKKSKNIETNTDATKPSVSTSPSDSLNQAIGDAPLKIHLNPPARPLKLQTQKTSDSLHSIAEEERSPAEQSPSVTLPEVCKQVPSNIQQPPVIDPKKEAGTNEAARKEAAMREAAIKEAANKEAVMKEVAKKEVAKKEAAMKEAAMKEAAMKEAAKKEAAQKEAAQREAAQKEAVTKEAARAVPFNDLDTHKQKDSAMVSADRLKPYPVHEQANIASPPKEKKKSADKLEPRLIIPETHTIDIPKRTSSVDDNTRKIDTVATSLLRADVSESTKFVTEPVVESVIYKPVKVTKNNPPTSGSTSYGSGHRSPVSAELPRSQAQSLLITPDDSFEEGLDDVLTSEVSAAPKTTEIANSKAYPPSPEATPKRPQKLQTKRGNSGDTSPEKAENAAANRRSAKAGDKIAYFERLSLSSSSGSLKLAETNRSEKSEHRKSEHVQKQKPETSIHIPPSLKELPKVPTVLSQSNSQPHTPLEQQLPTTPATPPPMNFYAKKKSEVQETVTLESAKSMLAATSGNAPLMIRDVKTPDNDANRTWTTKESRCDALKRTLSRSKGAQTTSHNSSEHDTTRREKSVEQAENNDQRLNAARLDSFDAGFYSAKSGDNITMESDSDLPESVYTRDTSTQNLSNFSPSSCSAHSRMSSSDSLYYLDQTAAKAYARKKWNVPITKKSVMHNIKTREHRSHSDSSKQGMTFAQYHEMHYGYGQKRYAASRNLPPKIQAEANEYKKKPSLRSRGDRIHKRRSMSLDDSALSTIPRQAKYHAKPTIQSPGAYAASSSRRIEYHHQKTYAEHRPEQRHRTTRPKYRIPALESEFVDCYDGVNSLIPSVGDWKSPRKRQAALRGHVQGPGQLSDRMLDPRAL
ncbi:hypothetical protein CANCADRAFT_46054 [Tortispora caseinolytica NRRL Y-17796]|uniref:Meiotically up-regulated protein Msb1/Mug8 domain-containing protein n=1 Tax=Tortispora caseinolytica NRRL Y-17796 TaxID=767744 RepID=A0A1E4TD26_9ASCO|nr:hypothetical protein CANCADRAFT_46054 [Tortispora caseinolytica NRRL Y-17796]